MTETKLLAYKVFKIDYENDIQDSDKEIHLDTNLETKVNYDEAEEKCIATCTLSMSSEDEDILFNVEIVLAGIFSYNKNDDKKNIHVEVGKKLFPYLQAKTSSLMSLIGIPDFVIPENEVNPCDVNM